MKLEHTGMILMLIFQILFVLLNAFYGGALTMFFTSAPTLPFGDLEAAVKAYPEWKYYTEKEDFLILSRYKTKNGQYGLQDALERMKNEPENIFVSDMEELTDKLLHEPGTVSFVVIPRFLYFVRTRHPNRLDSMTLFGNPYRTLQGFLIRKDCPHTRMINEGIRHLHQIGIMDKLYKKWVGEIHSDRKVLPQGFSFGQATICFVGLAVTYGFVLIIIVFENVWYKIEELGKRKH